MSQRATHAFSYIPITILSKSFPFILAYMCEWLRIFEWEEMDFLKYLHPVPILLLCTPSTKFNKPREQKALKFKQEIMNVVGGWCSTTTRIFICRILFHSKSLKWAHQNLRRNGNLISWGYGSLNVANEKKNTKISLLILFWNWGHQTSSERFIHSHVYKFLRILSCAHNWITHIFLSLTHRKMQEFFELPSRKHGRMGMM